jgi:hypothetical protein
MTANPLLGRQPAGPGKVTTAMLHDYADRLNRTWFVRHSGKPYHVGRKTDADGSVVHFLDRQP